MDRTASICLGRTAIRRLREPVLLSGRGFGLVVGQELDRPIEEMAGQAPDRGALERPVGRVHEEPAHHLGGKPASDRAILIQIGRAVNEHDLAVHLLFSWTCWFENSQAAVAYP